MKNSILNYLLVTSAVILLISCQISTESLLPQPHQYVLNAPKNISLWEPSAAVVIGDHLWVANDKPLKIGNRSWGVLAAYDLKNIAKWNQLRVFCLQNNLLNDLKAGKCDGNDPIDVALISGQKKLEAGALSSKGTVWWDTKGNKSVVCRGSNQEQCNFNGLQYTPNNNDLRKLIVANTGINLNDLKYVTVEALALMGDRTWIGIRGYKVDTSWVPWTAIVNQNGQLVWGGGKLVLDGKFFTISGFSVDKNGLWVTLSFEKPYGKNTKRTDVDGRLAWISLNAEGTIDSMNLCLDQEDNSKPFVLTGKPEGIAVLHEQLAIVYDSDKNRKEGKLKLGDGFPIRKNQDYLDLILKPDCSMGPILNTKLQQPYKATGNK